MNNAEQQILQRNLARFLIEEVFNTITDDDVLKITAPNVWEHKGKQLTPGQINALKADAIAYKNSGLYTIIKDELQWHALKRTHERASTESDLIAGKMLSYLIKVVDDRLEKMIKN
jgi:23S rRNA maturation-related 3'-5' exoribonuclease YhaM